MYNKETKTHKQHVGYGHTQSLTTLTVDRDDDSMTMKPQKRNNLLPWRQTA